MVEYLPCIVLKWLSLILYFSEIGLVLPDTVLAQLSTACAIQIITTSYIRSFEKKSRSFRVKVLSHKCVNIFLKQK